MNAIHRKCELCGDETASMFVERRKNGIFTRLVVCSKCVVGAIERVAPTLPDAAKFGGMLASLCPANATSLPVCDVCATALQGIKAHFRVGCSACYYKFADELAESIESVQPGRYHVGKTSAVD